MLSEEQLLTLNQQGLFPGPEEEEADFLQRVALTKKFYEDPESLLRESKGFSFPQGEKAKRHHWHWARMDLASHFDFIPDQTLPVLFSNKGLSFFQGAVTWFVTMEGKSIPLIQLRKRLSKGPFLWIYHLEEILSHEAVHGARAAFQEPQFEEVFAYLPSSSSFRRTLGPIIRSSWELLLFFLFFFLFLFCEGLFFLTSSLPFVLASLLFLSGGIGWFLLGLGRLFRLRRVLSKAYRKLSPFMRDQDKTMAMLFRCTDREIHTIASLKKEEIGSWLRRDASLRWTLLRKAYVQSDYEKV